MATIVSSIGLKGIEGYRVQVEVQLIPGIEGVNIVGLPDASIKESKDRVMAALYANDCQVPDKKIVQFRGQTHWPCINVIFFHMIIEY